MEKVAQAIYTAMRDDSQATVGLRALLGGSATPWNMFHGLTPTNFDFTSKGAITYLLVSETSDPASHATAARAVEDVYNITAYHRTQSTLEKIIRRIKWRLHDMRGITLPTSLASLHQVRIEGGGPDRYDEAFQVFQRTLYCRAWYRDDDLDGN